MVELQRARAEGRPLPARIGGVLRAPRTTFAALAASPRAADVLAVSFLAAAAAGALVLETDVGQLALLDHLERAASALGRPVDDAQYATLAAISANGPPYAIVTALVSGPLLACGLAAVLVALFRAPAGSRVTYGQVLAVVAHAGVILALRQVVAAPLTYARETMSSPFTLGVFLPLLDEAAPLARFSALVDLFVIWWIVVLAIGVSVLYRRPAARTAIAFAGTYVVLAALAALAAAVTGGAA